MIYNSSIRLKTLITISRKHSYARNHFIWWYSEIPVVGLPEQQLQDRLTSETIQSSALSLESVDDVEGGDGLSASVLGVGHRVTNDVLEKDLQDASGFFIDETTDALDASSSGETADGGLGDALDVIAKDLAVTLGSSLAETLSSLSSSGHWT